MESNLLLAVSRRRKSRVSASTARVAGIATRIAMRRTTAARRIGASRRVPARKPRRTRYARARGPRLSNLS